MGRNEGGHVLLTSAGASHSVALLYIICSWGRGADEQLGHGDAEDRFSPVQLSALDGHEVNSVTCGADHTLAYSEPRLQVYSWGWGDFGRLGHGNSSDVFIPQPIKTLGSVMIKQIACGDSHCLAVTMDGEVSSWGRNQKVSLDSTPLRIHSSHKKIQTFQGIPVKMVAAGAEHSAAVTEAGKLYGWGWGCYGNLGLGDRKDRLVPEKVSPIHGIKMALVACGWRHTITVTTSGNIYTYGWSMDNWDMEILKIILLPISWKLLVMQQCPRYQGVGGIQWRSHLMESCMAGDGIRKLCRYVVVGDIHRSLPRKNNVFSRGRGTNGQLGHGDSADRNLPTIIEALSMDGPTNEKIESSKADPSAGKISASFLGKYAAVPDESA